MAKIVIISAFKGGTLKSTIVSNMASELSRKGKKVLVLDLDTQNDQLINFNIDPDLISKNLYDCLIYNVPVKNCIYRQTANLDILVSDFRMQNYIEDILLNTDKYQNYLNLIQDRLKPIYNDYDYIIIDTAPNFNLLTKQSYMLKSQGTTDIIIPFLPELASLKNIVNQINVINDFKKNNNKNLNIKMVIPTKISRNNVHSFILDTLQNDLTDLNIPISKYPIKNTIKFTEFLIYNGIPLNLSDNDTKEYKDFKKSMQNIIKELNY